MEIIIWLVLSEAAVALALIIIILVLVIWILLGKTVVTVPSITLAVEKPQYDHGETVNVTGLVTSDTDKPAAGETVDLKLTDSASQEFDVGTTTTGPDGKYAASFAVPGSVAPGGVTISAIDAKLGVEATTTFTFERSKMSNREGIDTLIKLIDGAEKEIIIIG